MQKKPAFRSPYKEKMYLKADFLYRLKMQFKTRNLHIEPAWPFVSPQKETDS